MIKKVKINFVPISMIEISFEICNRSSKIFYKFAALSKINLKPI